MYFNKKLVKKNIDQFNRVALTNMTPISQVRLTCGLPERLRNSLEPAITHCCLSFHSDNFPRFLSKNFNQDYVIEFAMSVAIARKSGCLEILAQHRYGEIENSKEEADFEAISARNRLSIAYFGFKLLEG